MGNYDDTFLNMVDFCDINNGGRNPPAGFTGHPAGDNNWDLLESRFPSSPAYPSAFTPDPFYRTCDQADGDEPFASYIEIVEHSQLPIVATEPATAISEETVTLNGTVNPKGFATSILFEYGTTAAYGLTATAGVTPAVDDTLPVSANLTGLACGTVYHFRIRATNAIGTSLGADRVFKTRTCTILELTDTTVSTDGTFEACATVLAGPNVQIVAPARCALRAGSSLVLREPFSVAGNAELTLQIQTPGDCGPP